MLLGPFVKCPHPEMIEACGLAGFQVAVVDMEHTPLSPRDVYPLVLAAERRGLDLIVRIPEKTEPYFKWCLDMNVAFIQVPHVQTAEEARECIALSHFHPQGERGLCRFVRAADFGSKDRNLYLKGANERTKLVLQIEGVKGLQNIEEIVAVPGVEWIFVGPYDLSQSMGKPGQIWDPEVVAGVRKIIEICKSHGVQVGTFTDTPEGVQHWRGLGVHLVEYASDLALFMEAARGILPR